MKKIFTVLARVPKLVRVPIWVLAISSGVALADDTANAKDATASQAAVSQPAPGADSGKASGGDNTLKLSAGFDYSSGRYGTTQISSSTSIPAKLSYDTDSYLVAMTVPYIEQTAPAGTIVGKRRIAILGTHPIITQKGLGDVLADFTGHLIDNEDTGVSVDVTAEIKFATASAHKGLGTGKRDYSFEANVNKDFEKLGLSATAGYSVLGSPGNIVVNGVQQNLNFNNVYYGLLGSTYKVSETTKAGLTLHMEQASAIGAFEQKDVTADMTMKLSKATKLDLYILKGLSNGSPDKGFGGTVKASF